MSYEEKVKAIRTLKKYKNENKIINESLLLNEVWEPVYLKKGEESCIVLVHKETGKLIEKEEAFAILKGLMHFVSLPEVDHFIREYNEHHGKRIGKRTELADYLHEVKRIEEEKVIEQTFGKNNNEKGFVYFLRDEKDGTVKIGKTKNITERIEKHQKNFNYRLQELGYVFSNKYTKTEKLFHEHFKAKQLTKLETGDTEWFRLSKEELNMILIGENAFPKEILRSMKETI